MAPEQHDSELPACPFCGFKCFDTYKLMHHVETFHPENGVSPFVATEGEPCNTGHDQRDRKRSASPPVAEDWDTTSDTENGGQLPDADDTYIECPTGCGEQILFSELSVHLDFHFAESAVLEETGCEELAKEHLNKKYNDYVSEAQVQVSNKVAQALDAQDFVLAPKDARKSSQRGSDRPSTTSRRRNKGARASKDTTSSRRPRRASKTDLGPYATEKTMPAWLRRKLEEEPRMTRANKLQPDGTMIKVETIANQTPGLIPVLSELSRQDTDVNSAFLCHPAVHHVFKQRGEGGFCGYRNIQTLISYVQEARASGHEQFPGRMPTILALQDMIERAWDLGYNTASRNDVGRIKNTRKYIGTSEAQALFLSLNIGCSPAAFSATKGMPAYKQLLEAVRDYFLQGQPSSEPGKVVQTTLPPIYLQHSGHSLTIVGLEVRRDGSLCLLVFDPGFTQSPGAERIGKRITCSNPGRVLKAYRRGEEYLRRYREYEILKLSPTQFSPESVAGLSSQPA